MSDLDKLSINVNVLFLLSLLIVQIDLIIVSTICSNYPFRLIFLNPTLISPSFLAITLTLHQTLCRPTKLISNSLKQLLFTCFMYERLILQLQIYQQFYLFRIQIFSLDSQFLYFHNQHFLSILPALLN